MVQKFDKPFSGKGTKKSIKADIIILGCTLPGIVTAHKLKRRFGNTMDIVVLDLVGPQRSASKCNVAFQALDDETDKENNPDSQDDTTRQLVNNVAKYYLAKYAKEFSIPLPEVIITPEKVRSPLSKLFQHRNGQTVECAKDFHDFDYLSFVERFEMRQYQTLLDQSMKNLFQTRADTKYERMRLHYYDQTTMEKHICDALLFSTSREIMRNTVRLVCGAPASSVSVLFYLHQCHRTCGARNHLDGDNTKFREKLLGYCRKRLANKLQQSIADITLSAKSITEIRTYSDEQVVLETMKGETNYVCNLLAMALRPDQLNTIQVEGQLLSEQQADLTGSMKPGRAKKFAIQYEENFWRKQGYSGDILSIRGPIIWAMEKPRMSGTGSSERYFSLIGYLKVRDDNIDSQEAVIEQLIKLFGDEAATPVSYKERDVADLFIPRCGDFVALKTMTRDSTPKYLEWGALDIFADGDVAAALEAGHTAYLNLLTCLRPQAMTFEDLSTAEWPIVLNEKPLKRWLAHINVISTMHFVVFTAALCIGVRLLRSYIRKS
ncbi:uncharacterized protein LOC115448572 [Manduca sexta]|uniref:monoamine oxidase n=1 Tax=Manduca sexta TaxID=7130 RepID=A0A921YML4_MANSE|nr:uncharacterized protein LOC115448572 [Manduca sexta]KAG6441912.1 hypothetical protein O3G_MSEX002082 [Manduca sexta]